MQNQSTFVGTFFYREETSQATIFHDKNGSTGNINDFKLGHVISAIMLKQPSDKLIMKG